MVINIKQIIQRVGQSRKIFFFLPSKIFMVIPTTAPDPGGGIVYIFNPFIVVTKGTLSSTL